MALLFVINVIADTGKSGGFNFLIEMQTIRSDGFEVNTKIYYHDIIVKIN